MNDMPTPPSDGDSSAGSASPESSGAGSPADGAQHSSQAGPQYGPQDGPQYGPQYGPAPSAQHYGQSQPGPQGGSTRRFFDSLRGSGLMRTNERWIAGVAGGVAYRFGLDPVLVRCVWVVLSIFAGVGLVLYGVAWALLPEESDGRIHLEEALSGRFNAALAGAIGMTIVGMSTLGNGFIPSWYINLWGIPGIAAPVWSLFWLGLTVLAVILAVRFAQSRRGQRPGPQGPQPWQAEQHSSAQAPGSRSGEQNAQAAPAGSFPMAGSPAASSAAPDSSAPSQSGTGSWTSGHSASGQSWQNRSYRQHPPHQPTPMPVRPPRPRRPGPGSSVSLAVLGLGLLTGAGIWYATATHRVGLFQGQYFLIGTLVALLGAGILISGLRHRNGGWMTFLGWPALFVMAIPALATASVVPPSLAHMPFGVITDSATFGSTTVTWKELASSASGGSVTRSKDVGDLTLDLRGMPAEEAGRLSTITAHLDVGTLRIKTDTNQRVTVKADVDMGSVDSRASRAWTVDGKQMEPDEESLRAYDVAGNAVSRYKSSHGGLNIAPTLVSPSGKDGLPAITINASVDTGRIDVEESRGAVFWYGNAQESVWIVNVWYDEKSNAHDGELPVPGMSHPAITTGDAEACIRTARESTNQANRSQHVTWQDLSELTSEERSAYDACVQQALPGQSPAQPSASPTPSGASTSSPSQTPTPAPTRPAATDTPTKAG